MYTRTPISSPFAGFCGRYHASSGAASAVPSASRTTPKLDPVARAEPVVDVFLTPFMCTFTAFVGPPPLLRAKSDDEAVSTNGCNRPKVGCHLVKRDEVRRAAVGP